MLWDRLDYEWYNRVVSADEQAQMDALASFGLSKVRRSVLLAALAVGSALTVLGVFLWLKRSARPPDPAVRIWLGVCNRLNLALIDREYLFKDYLKHHDLRERNVLYPELDRITPPDEKAALWVEIARRHS